MWVERWNSQCLPHKPEDQSAGLQHLLQAELSGIDV